MPLGLGNVDLAFLHCYLHCSEPLVIYHRRHVRAGFEPLFQRIYLSRTHQPMQHRFASLFVSYVAAVWGGRYYRSHLLLVIPTTEI